MKLLRFGARGQERPGLIDADGGIRDLSSLVRDLSRESLEATSLERLRKVNPETLPQISTDVRIGPCVARCGKFICVGLNYRDHAREAGMAAPKEPVLFMKATSAISGPNDDIVVPPGATKVDWEVELGVILGAHLLRASTAEARAGIAGYCVVNDLSERAHQLEGTGQWVKGKSADTFGPIGPWLVTADEVSDPQSLSLWLEVNGVRRQNGSTRDMVFGAVELVSYVSRFMSLQPGDIISTGTPAGVGMGLKPPKFLAVGDRVRLGIEGLGLQTQRVISA